MRNEAKIRAAVDGINAFVTILKEEGLESFDVGYVASSLARGARTGDVVVAALKEPPRIKDLPLDLVRAAEHIVDQYGPQKKIQSIHVLRQHFKGLGLKEAKEVVEAVHRARA